MMMMMMVMVVMMVTVVVTIAVMTMMVVVVVVTAMVGVTMGFEETTVERALAAHGSLPLPVHLSQPLLGPPSVEPQLGADA